MKKSPHSSKHQPVNRVRLFLLFAILVVSASYTYTNRTEIAKTIQPPAEAVIGTLNLDTSTGGTTNFSQVGIGTTNPSVKLEINGGTTASITIAKFFNAIDATGESVELLVGKTVGSGQSGRIMYVHDSETVAKRFLGLGTEGGGTPLVVTNGGNVGIGTTNPVATLHIQKAGWSGSLFGYGDNGNVYIRPGTASGVVGFDLGTAYFTGGSVGIGIASPGYKFEVYNSDPSWLARIKNTAATNAEVYFSHGGGYGMHIRNDSASSSTYLLQAYNGALSNVNALYVRGDGNVGIGTGSPAAKLHTKGLAEGLRIEADSSYISFYNSAGTTRSGYIQFASPNVYVDNEQNGYTRFSVNGTEAMKITSTNVQIKSASNSWPGGLKLTSLDGLQDMMIHPDNNGDLMFDHRVYAPSISLDGYTVDGPQTSYGTIALTSGVNSYYGVLFGPNTNFANLMYDTSGNGGIYYQCCGWSDYYIKSNGHRNIGTSTDLGYALGVSGDVYATSWFRNAGVTGLYNNTYGGHLYRSNTYYWTATSSNGLILRTDYESTVRGYLYHDGSYFGLLNNAGSWGVRIPHNTTYIESNGFYDMSNGSYYLIPRSTSRLAGINADDIRSSVFYDYDDTTYYANFASTGRAIDARGYILARGGGNGGYGMMCLGDTRAWGVNKCMHAGENSQAISFLTENSGAWVGINAQWHWSSSDVRLKKNIEFISGNKALSVINQLQGRSYELKQNNDGRHYGFIAQEVEKVVPEIVTAGEGSNGMKGITYESIIPFTVEAIKEINHVVNVSDATSLKSPAIKVDSNGISHIIGIIVEKIQATVIETKKLIVNGVDILEKLNALAKKVDAQQKEIDELKLQLQELKK